MCCTTTCLMEWKQARSLKRNDKPRDVSHLSFHSLMNSQNKHRCELSFLIRSTYIFSSDPTLSVLLKQTRKVISSRTQDPDHSFNWQASPRIQFNLYFLSTLGQGQCYGHEETQVRFKAYPGGTHRVAQHAHTRETLNAPGGKGQREILKGTNHTMPKEVTLPKTAEACNWASKA